MHAVIPLQNVVHAPANPVPFGDGELRAFPSSDAPPRSVPCYVVPIAKANDGRAALDRLLALFKLWRNSPLWAQTYQVVAVGGDSPHGVHLGHYVPWEPPRQRLTDEDIGLFNAFWSERRELVFENFAVSRYFRADHRPYSKDQYVDYVTALEYLLTPGRDKGLSAGMAQAGCMLLGATLPEAERRRIYGELRSAYSVRGSIVHGKALGFADTNRAWRQRLDRARMLARDAILLFDDLGCLNDDTARASLIADVTMYRAIVKLPTRRR